MLDYAGATLSAERSRIWHFKNIKLLEVVLLALENIEKLSKETYIRNFSEIVFHDSKRLQSILSPVVRIFLDYGESVYQEETVLAQYHLIRNPGYVYIKGELANMVSRPVHIGRFISGRNRNIA